MRGMLIFLNLVCATLQGYSVRPHALLAAVRHLARDDRIMHVGVRGRGLPPRRRRVRQ